LADYRNPKVKNARKRLDRTLIKHVIIKSTGAYSSSDIPERAVSLPCPPWEMPDEQQTRKAVELHKTRKAVALDTEKQRAKGKPG